VDTAGAVRATDDPDDDPRHSVDWYRDLPGGRSLRAGQQFLIRCVDGPWRVRLETFPPRLEIEVPGGVYILEDDGSIHRWTYRLVPRGP
jgi:hypothetical protein